VARCRLLPAHRAELCGPYLIAHDVVIRAEGLGKKYVIGHDAERERNATLRDTVAQTARNAWNKTCDMARGRALVAGDTIEEFWALKDVSFEVKRGEVLGIIGRNGAGKSTLLKVLSRITEPTEGRVTIEGRVASLLEVGTGFHPELTGRENIYLNGAILGMTRAEIKGKFDEIVAFAEVERFLDTPVKRYSSGMYVRLAFGVAAHLEPEILIVDEVLSVGDAEFQKKCLGKMQDVAGDGRTVLFVSHNIHAVQALCDISVMLEDGRLAASGLTDSIVTHYLGHGRTSMTEKAWNEELAPGDSDLRLSKIRVSSPLGANGLLSTEGEILVDFEFLVRRALSNLCVGFDLTAPDGSVVFRSYQTDMPKDSWPALTIGLNRWRCIIPAGLLNGGDYHLNPRISIHEARWIVHDQALQFRTTMKHGVSPVWAGRPGAIAPILHWQLQDDERRKSRDHFACSPAPLDRGLPA
jgi:lipopolysaccharide transport system ATP-binding protein